MNVIEYPNYGGAEQLRIAERPTPEPGAGELRLTTRAFSINPIDWKLMSGKFRLIMPVQRPAVPCFDVCGVVDAVGPGVRGFEPGQRVFVRQDKMPGGVAGEQALVSASVTAHAPEGVSDLQFAAVPLVGMTALQGLRAIGALEAGKKVLVIGASGGVGHLAVQLAVNAGAQVTGVCSTRNVDFVRSLGAAEVIDYKQRSDDGGPYDAVYDCVGVDWGRVQAALAPEGQGATVMPRPGNYLRAAVLPLYSKQRLRVINLVPDAADLTILGQALAEGSLKVEIERVYEGLAATPDAMALSMEGRARGKIVVALAAQAG
ncbi:MAG: NAD(P)-dependent alcohol dehydrogenase [Alphaproteobacteria bacterium]|nr:NAD(P)-dependent alcohol dehydrogenase [Alphaproteobacteria bacterium]MCB9796599.1 NAD(P)-dependent alcohol dehydrogenase [Alphaproteobacteria bacterium]